MDRHRVGIVIPALNEAGTIGAVVASILRYGVPILVDDGSSDATGTTAAAAGAALVRHERNQGYDKALNSGFAHAEKLGCQYVLTMDADGQHDSTIVCDFLKALEEGAEVVAGVRDRRQRFSEHLFAWVAQARWGLRDPLCGMKAYRIEVYQALGHFDSYNSIGTELVLHAANSGRRIVQIPVKTRDRVGAPRFGQRLSANMRIIRALLFGLFHTNIC